MDNVDFIITILVNLVLTILGYCTVPTILRLKKGKYEYKKGHKIILINCAIVWLIFTIIKIEQGLNATGGAVILYYFVNKAILLKPKEELGKDNKEEKIEDNQKDQMDEYLYEITQKDKKEMLKEIEENTKKTLNEIEEKTQSNVSNNKTLIYTVISILVVIILGIGAYTINLYNENKELKTDKIATATNTNTNTNKSKRLSKIEFESEIEKFESKAVEIWVSGTYEDTIYDEIIILKDVAYRFMRLGLESPICKYYEINFLRNYNNDVVVSYDNVSINGKIKGNLLELYMDDGRIYADFKKK